MVSKAFKVYQNRSKDPVHKSKVEVSKNFVAFSEYMNFTTHFYETDVMSYCPNLYTVMIPRKKT